MKIKVNWLSFAGILIAMGGGKLLGIIKPHLLLDVIIGGFIMAIVYFIVEYAHYKKTTRSEAQG